MTGLASVDILWQEFVEFRKMKKGQCHEVLRVAVSYEQLQGTLVSCYRKLEARS